MNKLDIKLWTLAARGQIVPDRSLLKTPAQIRAIKKSAALNTAVLDHVSKHIRAGMNTEEIDRLVYDFTKSTVVFPRRLIIKVFPRAYAHLSTMSYATEYLTNMKFWKKAILSMWMCQQS